MEAQVFPYHDKFKNQNINKLPYFNPRAYLQIQRQVEDNFGTTHDKIRFLQNLISKSNSKQAFNALLNGGGWGNHA